MFWNRSSAAIFRRWQLEIDHSLETGQTPLLQLGENSALLDGLPGMSAVQEIVDRRVLVHTPLVLSGGSSIAWLWLLWQRGAATERARSGGVRVIFGGADAATMIASTAVTSAAEADRLHYWSEVRPVALASHIEPESQPAVVTGLTGLPLQVMSAEVPAADNSLQDWVAWLAVALVITVIVLSTLMNR